MKSARTPDGAGGVPAGRRGVFWALTAGGAVLDLATKALAFRLLTAGGRLEVIPGLLDLWRSTNTGCVFGIGKDSGWLMTLVSAVAAAVVVGYAFRAREGGAATLWGLALVLGGAVGNLWDRLLYGHVRDFLSVYVRTQSGEMRWPTFNVADALLCVGVGLLVIASFAGGPVKSGGSAERRV